MAVDLVLRQARRAEAKEPLVVIAIAGGHIVNIAQHIVADAPAEELDSRPVIAGFIEGHIQLAKKDTCLSIYSFTVNWEVGSREQ
jgi:hypothetical protein